MGALSPASSTAVTRRSLVSRLCPEPSRGAPCARTSTSLRGHADHRPSRPVMTVVLIHGGGATGGFWDRLLPYLDEDGAGVWAPSKGGGRGGFFGTVSCRTSTKTGKCWRSTCPAAGHGRRTWPR